MISKLQTFACLLLLVAPVAAQDEDVVDDWFDRAERYASRGSWNRAATYFEKVLAVESDDVEVASKLVTALEGCGRYEERDALTARFLAARPEDVDWLLVRCDLLVDVGRDDEALEILKPVAANPEADFRVLAAVGRLHEARGREKDAEGIYDRLIEGSRARVVKDPKELTALADAYLFHARRRAHMQGAKLAEEVLYEAQKVDKTYALAFERLSLVYATAKERPSDARRELRDALKLKPRWADYQVALANVAELLGPMGTGDRKEAIVEALRTNPRHPGALFWRGFQEMGDARWAAAEETLDKALETNPNDLDALSGRAALAFLTHDTATYEAMRAKVLKRHPKYGRFHVIVANALSERRRWDESLTQARMAAELDPQDHRNHDAVALYALFLGQDSLGKDALEKADAAATCGTVWRKNMYMVLGKLEDYPVIKTDHYVLRLPPKEKDVLERYFPAFLERSWKELVERYQFEPKSPVIFDVLEKAEDFSVRTMGTTGLGALGVCFGPTVFMDSPGALKPGQYNWAATAHHEMVHVFTLQLSRGRTTRWLTEGLSSYEEIRRNASWGRDMEIMLHDAYHNESLFGIENFDAGFATARIGFAYYQGNLTCRFIEETWGFDSILEMLKAYGQDKLTRAVLKDVLKTTPEEFDARFRDWVAAMLAPIKRIPAWDADSTRRFKKAIDAGEDVTGNRINLAWSYFKRRKWVDSDAALNPLIASGVEDPRLELLLGMRAWRDKRRDVAEEHFKKAIAGGVEDHTMFVRLAQLAERRDDSEASLRWWQKAKATNPWSLHPKLSPYLNLARLHRGVGETEKWAAEVEGFCALADTAVALRMELVDHYLQSGNVERATALLEEILDVTPFDAAPHVKLGKIHDDAGRAEAAVRELRTALDLSGVKGAQEVDVRLRLARQLISLDMEVDATYHLDRVLELDPGNERASKLLEDLGEGR